MNLHSSPRRGAWFHIALILTVAAVLRILTISHQSLWLDELASWWFSSGTLDRAMRAEPYNPPLYFVLLHFWIALFGVSEAAMRSLSVIPSVLSVWLVYRLGVGLLSREIALVAAGYQAISTFQIYYAQEARVHALLVCFVLAASLLLWNALGAGSLGARIANYAGYTLVCALALYAHFFTCFFLAAHALFVLFRKPRQVLWAAVSMGLALLSFLPWLLIMLRTAGGGGQVRRYLWLKLPQAYFSLMFGDTLIPLDEQAVRHIPQVLRENCWIIGASLASALVLALYARLAWKRWGDPLLYALSLAVIPALIAFAVSFRIMLFDERYLGSASPFLYLAISAAVWEVVLRARERGSRTWKTYAGWAAAGTYAVLLLVSLHHYYFDPRYGKEQWREAVAYVEGAVPAQNSDLVVFDPDYLDYCFGYYQRKSLPGWRVTDEVRRNLAGSTGELEKRVRGYDRVWLVRSHYDDDLVLNLMRSVLHQDSYREFPKAKGIEVYGFVAPPAAVVPDPIRDPH